MKTGFLLSVSIRVHPWLDHIGCCRSCIAKPASPLPENSPPVVDPNPVRRPIIIAHVDIRRAVSVEIAKSRRESPVEGGGCFSRWPSSSTKRPPVHEADLKLPCPSLRNNWSGSPYSSTCPL